MEEAPCRYRQGMEEGGFSSIIVFLCNKKKKKKTTTMKLNFTLLQWDFKNI